MDPSGTVTGLPSTVSSTGRRAFGAGASGIGPRGTGILSVARQRWIGRSLSTPRKNRKARKRRVHCTCRGVTQTADRRVAHHLGNLSQEQALLLDRTNEMAGMQALQKFLLAHSPNPARHALAAALVTEEIGDAQQDAPRSTLSSKGMTTADPTVAPIARIPSKVKGASSSLGAIKAPAAPPTSTAWRRPVPETPPARSMSSRTVTPNVAS